MEDAAAGDQTIAELTYSAKVVAFETERLRARGYSEDDAEDAFAMYSDPRVVKFLIGMAPVKDLDEQRAWLRTVVTKYQALGRGFGGWAVVEKGTDRVVGTALFKLAPLASGAAPTDLEIGWHLAPRVWGRGYATEVGHALLAYGHARPDGARLIALIEPGNARSAAVAERLGMRHVGLSDRFYSGGPLNVWESCREPETR